MLLKRVSRMLISVAVLSMFAIGSSGADDIERAERILNLVERGCLSGARAEAGAGISARLSGLKNILKEGASGELKGDAFKEQVRGALNFVDGELKKAENDAIRACIQPHMEKIIDLLISSRRTLPGSGASFAVAAVPAANPSGAILSFVRPNYEGMSA